MPVSYNRKYKQIFKWGIQEFNFGPEDFSNSDHKTDFSTYLQNICRYLGLKPATLGTQFRLKSNLMSKNFIAKGNLGGLRQGTKLR